ncbi:MAG: hypothetical protein CMH28_09220 [Micavibrio sp.]|nr:hypothetical protein [Micavibrio sp.]
MKSLTMWAFCALILIGNLATAQKFAFSAQLAYASPKGEAFTDAITGERLSSFGLGADFDFLYHIEGVPDNLYMGITHNSNLLFGRQSENTSFDFGLYSLRLYGLKGVYRFLDGSVSPYGSLSLGLSRFITPEVTSGGQVLLERKNAYSFGVRPEVGLDIHGFLLSVAYVVPMDYYVSSGLGAFSGTAGALQFSAGYRVYFAPF